MMSFSTEKLFESVATSSGNAAIPHLLWHGGHTAPSHMRTGLAANTANVLMLESVEARDASRAAHHAVPPFRVSVHMLVTRRLKKPLEAIVESDGAGFLARAADFELYGLGDNAPDAVAALRREIESLYEDLSADDNFSAEWLATKALLTELVIDA
jgi:hypothetical protein